MTYEPTLWHDGDYATPTKMNKMENHVAAQGVGFGVFWIIVSYDETEGLFETLDVSAEEIKAALSSGNIVVVNLLFEDSSGESPAGDHAIFYCSYWNGYEVFFRRLANYLEDHEYASFLGLRYDFEGESFEAE